MSTTEAPAPIHPVITTESHGGASSTGITDGRTGARIRIANTTRPFRYTRSDDVTGTHINDGIYNMRSFSRPPTLDRRSLSRSRTGEKETEDDDPGLRQPGDFKTKQVFCDSLR